MFQGTDTENHAINGATVQLGVQQRSGSHFQECVKMIQDGYIGRVSHCVLMQSGNYGGPMQPTAPVPEDLDWEMFRDRLRGVRSRRATSAGEASTCTAAV